MTKTAAAGAARMFPVATDYGRFSGQKQEAGHSAERQLSLADAWSQRTGIPIDLSLFDEAASGWGVKGRRRLEDDTYDLARYLKLIEAGRVQPGDYLLLDNFDRLSRDKEVRATHLLTSILVAGVKVVQLAPDELLLTEDSDMFTVFRAVMELARGHSESERKHQVCSASYAGNRVGAATCHCGHPWHGGQCQTAGCSCGEFVAQQSYQGNLPAWLRREGEGKGARHRRIVPVPGRVATVRSIFLWAAQGLSDGDIARRLIAESVPPFGARKPRLDAKTGKQARTRTGRLRWQAEGGALGSGKWNRAYVAKILADRAAMGELKTKTGEVVPIPPAVTEEEWLAAQSGRADRRDRHGRKPAVGPEPLFASLLIEAGTGLPYYLHTDRRSGRVQRLLCPYDQKGGTRQRGRFPESVFEAAVTACLDEIDPAEVTGTVGPDQVALLNGRLGQIGAQLDELKEQAKECTKVPKTLVKAMVELEEEAERLEEERRQAQKAAAQPLSETWGQAKSLLGMLDTAEKRLRFRSLLRQMVEEIRLLVVPRGWDRVAAVQMHFRGSEEPRSWLIVYRPAITSDGRRARWRRAADAQDVSVVRDLRPAGTPLDLRRPEHVAALRKQLETMDLSGVQ
jgi:hypothetical protein